MEVLLEQTAKDHGLGLSKTVKMLLHKALGLDSNGNGDRKADFTEFSVVDAIPQSQRAPEREEVHSGALFI